MGENRDITIAYLLMVGLLLLRVVFAAWTPLIVDEAYAVAAARGHSLSFFDHPPVAFNAALWSAELLGRESALIFRIPTILFATGTAWMIWKIGKAVGGPRAGLITLGLYAVSPALALSGSYIVPDGPLTLGSTICIFWLVRIVQEGPDAPLRWWGWVGAGLAFALASKYQAALIPIMAVIFALTERSARRWFAEPGPYLAALIGLVGLLPFLIWNANNDWASFAFHSGRTGDGLQIGNFALMVLGQFLYLLPPVAVVAALALWRGLRREWLVPEHYLLALQALGPVAFFGAIYLFSEQSFPHWTMPGWLFALPLTGAMLAEAGPRTIRRVTGWSVAFFLPFLALLGVLVAHVNTGLLTKAQSPTPSWDRTTDVFDYSELTTVLEARGLLADTELLAVRGWIEAGFMSTGLQGRLPVRVLTNNKHHFKFLPGEKMGGRALMLHPDTLRRNDMSSENQMALARRFDPDAQLLEPVILQRGGRDYIAVTVIRLTLPVPGT